MTEYSKSKSTKRSQILTLMAAVAIVGSNGLLLGPVLSEVGEALETSTASVAWAMSAYGVGTALSALFLAPVIDRIGERRAIQRGITLLFISLLASATANQILILSAAQFLAGIGAGIILPAAYAMATLLSEPGKESGTLGRVLMGWSLSLVFGVPAATFIAEHLHWRVSYILLMAGLIVVALLLQRRGRIAERAREHAAQYSVIFAFRLPGVLPMLTIGLIFTGSFYGVYAFIASEAKRMLSLSTGEAGLVVLAFGAGFASAAYLSRMLDKWGARTLLPMILLSNAAVYAVMSPALHNYTWILILAFIWGCSNHLCLNAIVMLLTRIRPNMRGALLGLNSATTYTGVTVGTGVAGYVFPHAGFSILPVTAAFLHFGAALFFYWISRRFLAFDTGMN